jgi:tetratricopeptide (TPR) repeat protein
MFRTQNPKEQLDWLRQARPLFEKALSMAESTQDVLEILENLTELAFLTDDYLIVLKSYDPKKFEKEKKRAYQDIERFREYIKEYKKDEDKIFQFPVFQNLLEIEQAAYHFVLGEYDEALPLYIKGYVGMAQFSGYGVARYLQHIDHIINQLNKLFKIDQQRCTIWCEAILDAWDEANLTEVRTELPQEIEMFMDTIFMILDESE